MIIKLSTSVKIIVDVILVGRCWEIWWWRRTKIVWCWEQWLNIICLLPRLSMILPIQSAGWACGTVNTSTTISTIIFIWWLETSVTCISSRILSSKEISNYEDVVVAKEKVYTRGSSQSKRCIKMQGQDGNKRGCTTSCIWKMKVAVAIGVSNLQVNSVLKLCHLILLVQLLFWKHL